MSRHCRNSERGAALPFVLVLVVALFGMVALVVDGGRAYDVRRRAQNATDAAALAAAADIPAGAGAAGTTARLYVQRNGFDPARTTVHQPPSTGSRAGDLTCIEVVAEGDVRTYFAVLLGIDSFDASARSVACRTLVGGAAPVPLPAIFAGASGCGATTLDWSGSSTAVVGSVHSNGGIKVGGSSNSVTGTGTFVAGLDAPPDKIVWNPAAGNPAQRTSAAWPTGWSIQDYRPGGTRAVQAGVRYYNAGSQKIDAGWLAARGLYVPATGQLQPGVYYTAGDVDLSMSGIRGQATFVAEGVITMSGSNQTLTAFESDGLLAFSSYQKSSPLGHADNCSAFGIAMAGSTNRWEGVLYAPRSGIEISGSSNSSVVGSAIGYTVKLNGSSLALDNRRTAATSSPAVEQLSLVE